MLGLGSVGFVDSPGADFCSSLSQVRDGIALLAFFLFLELTFVLAPFFPCFFFALFFFVLFASFFLLFLLFFFFFCRLPLSLA